MSERTAMPMRRRNLLTAAVSIGLLVVTLVVPATGQQATAPLFYRLLPRDYPYPLIRVCATAWGICAIPATVPPGAPCQCLAANGAWVPGVCTH
jgi:hypothetical protein